MLATAALGVNPSKPHLIRVSTKEMSQKSHKDEIENRQKLEAELSQWRAACGSYRFELIEHLDRLALICHQENDYENAAAYYREIIEIREDRLKGCDQTQWQEARLALMTACHRLALVCRIKGNFAEAERFYLKACQLAVDAYGADHEIVVERRNFLAGLYFAQGSYEEAEKILLASLDFYSKRLGEKHKVVALTCFALALTTRKLPGAEKRSQDYFNRTKALTMPNFASLDLSDGEQFSRALMHLAGEKYRAGRYEEAEELFRQLVLRELSELWPEHPLVADSYQLLGDLFKSFNMPGQAEELYKEAANLRRRLGRSACLGLAQSLHSLGTLLLDNRRVEEAERYLREACQLRKDSFPPVQVPSLKALATALRKLQRTAEAIVLEEQAEQILEDYRPSAQQP